MDGFYGGASQFAGGGFMPSPAPGNENQYGAGGDNKFKKGGSNRHETIRAVTVRQVLKFAHGEDSTSTDGEVLLDGAPLTCVTLVARILDFSENAIKTTYRVHDGTGPLEVLMHTQEDDEAFQVRKRELQPGTYARVYGTVRRHDGTLGITAYTMKPVQDFNEVTYHNLQVIFQHLHLLKGAPPAAPPPAAQHMTPTGAPAYGAPGGDGAPGGYGAVGGNLAGSAHGGIRSGDPATDVMAVFRDPSNRNLQHGLNAQAVDAQLKSRNIHYTLQQIRDAIDFGSNEGHLYSTTEDFYKLADA